MSSEFGHTSYGRDALLEGNALTDPLAQLRGWLDEAAASGAIEPTAMALATADRDGNLSNRMVLLRGLDARGLRFFTSYASDKAQQLEQNARAAATLWWGCLERQVRVEGSIGRIAEEESDEYFAGRPRGHQLAAWASEQSAPIEDRATLEERFAHFDARFGDEPVPRPHSWGGYVLTPARIEFWQGRPNRMHDRLAYRRVGGAWTRARLQP